MTIFGLAVVSTRYNYPILFCYFAMGIITYTMNAMVEHYKQFIEQPVFKSLFLISNWFGGKILDVSETETCTKNFYASVNLHVHLGSNVRSGTSAISKNPFIKNAQKVILTERNLYEPGYVLLTLETSRHVNAEKTAYTQPS